MEKKKRYMVLRIRKDFFLRCKAPPIGMLSRLRYKLRLVWGGGLFLFVRTTSQARAPSRAPIGIQAVQARLEGRQGLW